MLEILFSLAYEIEKTFVGSTDFFDKKNNAVKYEHT